MLWFSDRRPCAVWWLHLRLSGEKEMKEWYEGWRGDSGKRGMSEVRINVGNIEWLNWIKVMGREELRNKLMLSRIKRVQVCLPASILCTAGATSTSVRLSQLWAWYSLTSALPCNANHTPWPYTTMQVTHRLLSVPTWNQCWDGGMGRDMEGYTHLIVCLCHNVSPCTNIHLFLPTYLLYQCSCVDDKDSVLWATP